MLPCWYSNLAAVDELLDLLAIGPDLLGQLGRAGKSPLLAQVQVKLQADLLVVNIFVEPQKNGLDQAFAMVEGYSGSDADGSWVACITHPAAPGIDSLGGGELLDLLEVGCGQAKLSAAPGATADDTGNNVWSAEALGGLSYQAAAQQFADQRAGDGKLSVASQVGLNGFEYPDLKIALAAQFL